MRSTNNTRNMLGRPNPYRKTRQAGTLDDLMFDMDKRRHTSFRFQNYQNFITDRPGKFDVRYRQKNSWCALDEETGKLDYLLEDDPSASGGRRQSTSSVDSRTTNGDRDSLLALARESSSGSGAAGAEEDDSVPSKFLGRKDSGILPLPRRSALAAQGLMSPIKPVLEGASTPKPSSGRSWVAPQFAIDPENRSSRVLHEDASADPSGEDGASIMDMRGDAIAVLPTASNIAAASTSPPGNDITLSPIPSNRQLLQAVARSPASRSSGSCGRCSSTSTHSFGTSSMRSAGSCARRSGGSGSNDGSSGSSRVSGNGGLGSGVAAGSKTVVVQTIKSSGRGDVKEGGQGKSDGSSTLKAACVIENNVEVDTAAGGEDTVAAGNPGREPSYGTISQQAGASVLASNGGEDGGGDFPRKSEVSTYFSSTASGTGWSDAPEGSRAELEGMSEAMENRGMELGHIEMDVGDSGVVVISSADPSLLVGIPRVDDGKLEHDKERRLGVAGDLEAVIAELSRRKSSLAWEDGEGASVLGQTSPDETGTGQEVELHQNKRIESATGALQSCDNFKATASPKNVTVDQKKESAPVMTEKRRDEPLPKDGKTLSSPSSGPVATPASLPEISEAFVKTSGTVTGVPGAKGDISGAVSETAGTVFYAERRVTSVEDSRATVKTSGPHAEISGPFAGTSGTGAEIFVATAETTGSGAKYSKAAAQTIGSDAKKFRSPLETSGAVASPYSAAATASVPPMKVDPVSVQSQKVTGEGHHPESRAAVMATAAAAMAAASARSPRVVAKARATVAAKSHTNMRASHTTPASREVMQTPSPKKASKMLVCEGVVETPVSGGEASTAASRGTVKPPASKGLPEVIASDGVVKTPVSRKAVKVSTSGRVIRMPASGTAANKLSCKEEDSTSVSKGAIKTKASDDVGKTTSFDTTTGEVATEVAVKQRSHRPRYDAPTASSAARAHGVSNAGVGKCQSSAQHQGRQLGRGREERLTKQGRSPLGRRSLSAPPATPREEVACSIDTMISDFVTPSDLVTSIKERVKGAPPLSGVPGDAYHGNKTASPSPVGGAFPAGSREKRGAIKNQKQERSDAARNISEAVVKPAEVSMTDDERSTRPGSTRSGRGAGRSGRRGSSVEATRSAASPAMPPPPPPASRGGGTQGKARKGKYQVKDSFNRLKGWIHGGFAGGGDRKNNAHGSVASSARGGSKKASKERRGTPSAAGVSKTEAAKSVGDSKSLKDKAMAGRAAGVRHGSTVSSSEAMARDDPQPPANPSSSTAPANPGMEKGGRTLDELGHMTVVEMMRERGRTMERPLQAASAGSSPSPSPSPSPPASPFQPAGEGSAPEQVGVAPRRIKMAAVQGSSTPTLAPSSGRSKTASVARSLGATVPPLSAACRTVSNSPRVPVGKFRSPVESSVPVENPPSTGGKMRSPVDGVAAGGRGREGAATVKVENEACASGARSHRGKKSTKVRGESTVNGDTKRSATKGSSRSRKSGK